MAASDDSFPEPLVDKPADATAEVTPLPPLPPEDAHRVTTEIRAVAESRGEPSEDFDRVDLATSARLRRPASLPPTPIELALSPEGAGDGAAGAAAAPADDEQLTADELRDAWPLLDLEERADGLRVLPREDAEDFFVSLSPADHAALLLHFRPGQRRQWMRLLEPDDAADVIQRAPGADRDMLLALLDTPTRKEVTGLLAYAEDEAGGLMSTRYARLRPQMTVGEAISYLQRQSRDRVETIYTAYVLDPEQHLLGVVSFRDLLAADPKRRIDGIMETDVQRVTDEMDQEEVSRLFAERDLTVIPVVDQDGRMKGIVTIDDIVDVVQEAATEDAQKFGGVEVLDLPYLESSRRAMIRKRGRWLTILLVGEMLTATALGFFEKELIPLLALFLPLIISSGGNSGSQASTLVIRAMALGEVRGRDWWLVMRREIAIGLALGALLGGCASIRVLIWGAAGSYGEHWGLIGIVVALSVTGCVLWGTLAGAMLPFLLRKIGADPANASAPLVATLVDVSGIVIYFTIAKLLLSGVII
jgi:magnesium transporter